MSIFPSSSGYSFGVFRTNSGNSENKSETGLSLGNLAKAFQSDTSGEKKSSSLGETYDKYMAKYKTDIAERRLRAEAAKTAPQEEDEYVPSTNSEPVDPMIYIDATRVDGIYENEAQTPANSVQNEKTVENSSKTEPTRMIDELYQSQMKAKFHINQPFFMGKTIVLPSDDGQKIEESVLNILEPRQIGNIFSYVNAKQVLGSDVMTIGINGSGLAAASTNYDGREDFVSENMNISRARYSAKTADELQSLNSRIAEALKTVGVELSGEETLEYSVDLDGKITLKDGAFEENRKTEIENALNSDETLGRELLVNFAKHKLIRLEGTEGKFENDATASRIVASEILRNETGLSLSDLAYDETEQKFYDKTGKIENLDSVTYDYISFHGLHNSIVQSEEGIGILDSSLKIDFTFRI